MKINYFLSVFFSLSICDLVGQTLLPREVASRSDCYKSDNWLTTSFTTYSFSDNRGGDQFHSGFNYEYGNIYYYDGAQAQKDEWVTQTFDANNNLLTITDEGNQGNNQYWGEDTVRTYNQYGHLNSVTEYNRADPNSLWTPYQRFLYTNTPSGSILVATEQQFYGQWENINQEIAQYNESNLDTFYQVQTWNNGTWQPHSNWFYQYNGAGYLLSSLEEDLEVIRTDVVNAQWRINMYDTNNNLLTAIIENGNWISNNWFFTSGGYNRYSYINNNLVLFLGYNEDTTAVDDSIIYSYDETHHMISQTEFYTIWDIPDTFFYGGTTRYYYSNNLLDSVVVPNKSKQVYAYDNNGNVIIDASYISDTSSRILTTEQDYQYNIYNQRTFDSLSYGSVPQSRNYYYYQEYPATDTVSMYSVVYPNPVSTSFQVRFNSPNTDEAVLTLYDITGKKVTTTQSLALEGDDNIITWDAGYALTAGIYLYKLQVGNAISTGRIVAK